MDARRTWRARRCEDGQAAVAFLATVPVLILVALALLQFVLAGHAVVSAGNAARAAARAEYAGTDPHRAARRALPPSFRDAAEIDAGRARIAVELTAPRALPVGPRIPVTASALLGPSGGVPDG